MLRHSLLTGMAVFTVAELATSLPCQAQLKFYTDRPSFLAASTGDTTIGFEGIASFDLNAPVSTPPGITLSGVNFNIDHSTGNNGFLAVDGPGYAYPTTSVLSSGFSSTVANNLVITLPSAETAIGLNIGSITNASILFTLSDGSTFNAPPAVYPGLNFVGFTSAIPITSLTLEQPASGTQIYIDNFTFGTATSAVPEPAFYQMSALVILGGIGLLRQFRKKAGTNV